MRVPRGRLVLVSEQARGTRRPPLLRRRCCPRRVNAVARAARRSSLPESTDEEGRRPRSPRKMANSLAQLAQRAGMIMSLGRGRGNVAHALEEEPWSRTDVQAAPHRGNDALAGAADAPRDRRGCPIRP